MWSLLSVNHIQNSFFVLLGFKSLNLNNISKVYDFSNLEFCLFLAVMIVWIYFYTSLFAASMVWYSMVWFTLGILNYLVISWDVSKWNILLEWPSLMTQNDK